MNKLIKTVIVFILIATIASCKKTSNTDANQPAALTATVQQGLWKVTNYQDNGVNETNHYSGYEFQFKTDGTITATKAGSIVSGTWSDRMDDSTLKLILDFGTTTVFQEINNDWHVTQQSASIIKLEDVSGGGSGTDYLTFEKI